ncbi:MAG TPA: TPM domain-containing protein, partial [Thermodesulfobacteriota bacterium]|nr:TPM domain-containing protein [Thermodesulfobacteriota bacterium]
SSGLARLASGAFYFLVSKTTFYEPNFFCRSGLFFGICYCCLLCFCIGAYPVAAEHREGKDYPSPSGAINDFAEILSPGEEEALNQLAVELWIKANVSLAIVTFDTIGDADPGYYARRLYESWGLGKADKERGVLAVLVLDQRRALLVSGSDAHGLLSQDQESSIVRDYLAPALQTDRCGSGLLEGMRVVSQIIAEGMGASLGKAYQPRVIEQPHNARTDFGMFYLAGFSGLLLVVILPYASSRTRKQGTLTRPEGPLLGGFTGGFGSGFGGGFGDIDLNQQHRRRNRRIRPNS